VGIKESEHMYHITSQVHEKRCVNTTPAWENTDQRRVKWGERGRGRGEKGDNKTKPALKKIDPKDTNMGRE